MIVLEGPDGSGKTTLLANLLDKFPRIQEHTRASSSVGGPLPEIQEWAKTDLATQAIQPLSFYDRHPMFSEPIYGPLVRNNLHEWFFGEEAQLMGQMFIENSLIVICLPPLEHVVANVDNNDQMHGVVDNIGTIYSHYDTLLRNLAMTFPHNVFHYDYTKDDDLFNLQVMIHAHATRTDRKQNGRIA